MDADVEVAPCRGEVEGVVLVRLSAKQSAMLRAVCLGLVSGL